MSADESRSFDINIPTGIEDEKIYGNMNVTIDSYVHENNLNINYYIHQSQNIRLRLFNALGQEISVLYDAYTNSGNHHLEYNTAHLPAGIYIISLSSDNSLNMNKFYIDK
jgi:hypothetical protein